MLPFCACSEATPPPPAIQPPPPPGITGDWDAVPAPVAADGTVGGVSGYVREVARGRVPPARLRSSTLPRMQCPGAESGREACVLGCAKRHLGFLRAVSVTGRVAPPSPPPPPPPPQKPPMPSLPPGRPRSFNGCSDVCEYSRDGRCDDGGLGSVFPALCAYGSDCSDCNVRTEVQTVCANTCAAANDGYCQDGGEGSRLSDLLDGSRGALCLFGTDCADCGTRQVTSYGEDSYTPLRAPPLPLPLPSATVVASPTEPAPPPPPPDAWDGCLNTCISTNGLCEDGGLASVAAICTLGTDCEDCGYRVPTTVACSNTCANHANDGVCDDGGQAPNARGTCPWGTDCADCGSRVVVPGSARRALQQAAAASPPPSPSPSPPSPSPSPPPPPRPPPPSPSPHPPMALDECECSCFATSWQGLPDIDADIGLRAHATEIEHNSVTYAVLPALTRGPSRAVEAELWLATSALRYARTPALDLDVALLVTGWRQGATLYNAEPTRVGHVALQVDHVRPAWYTANDDGWRNYPNGSAFATPDRLLARCAAFCGAYPLEHTPLAYIQLELTAGAEACSCYTRANASVTPATDAEALEWLGGATRVNEDVGGVGQDVRIYAVHPREPPVAQYVGALLGTAFQTPAIEAHFDAAGYAATDSAHEDHDAIDLDDCVARCARALNTSLRAVRFDYAQSRTATPSSPTSTGGSQRCFGFTERPLDVGAGVDWAHDATSTAEWVAVRFCDGVRHASNDRTTSLVWSKQTEEWCRGQPSYGGMVLGASQTHYDVAAVSSEPPDAVCRARCDAESACAYAQLFETTWEALQAVHALPPPPSPPAPPSPPPPQHPPFAPLPPLAPAGNVTGWRAWHPRTEVGELPGTDADTNEFVVTCGVDSCGFRGTVFSGSQLQALDVARDLALHRVTSRAVCPWEVRHATSNTRTLAPWYP